MAGLCTVIVLDPILSQLSGKIFLISSMIALLVDPLFLYIPIVDEGNKCLGMDKTLRTACLILRSLGDTTFIVHIIYQIREAMEAVKYELRLEFDPEAQTRRNLDLNWVQRLSDCLLYIDIIIEKLSWRSVITNFLALLPIPQVLILVFFFSKRSFGDILNIILFAQYLPRIYRARLFSKTTATTSPYLVKIVFYFFLYILACHVVGAFWYFFSIQREMTCWYQASVNHNRSTSTFYCDDSSSRTKNTTLLHEFCPINSPDPTVFDFGIFLESLQSRNKGSLNFLRKICFSIWWAMRNLSSFGQNLVTSNFAGENFFAILISVSLPIYTLFEYYSQNKLKMEGKMEAARRKIEQKELDLKEWMSRNNVPPHLQKEIIVNITHKLEEDADADVENLFSVLPWNTKKALKRFLCMNMLKNIPELQAMDEKVLKMMCDYLKPVSYAENRYIVGAGEPVNLILLVTEGVIQTSDRYLEKGDVYGAEQLLSGVSSQADASLPISEEDVRCLTKVEGFTLLTKDLKTIVSKCGRLWRFNNITEEVASASSIRRRRGDGDSLPTITDLEAETKNTESFIGVV